MLIASIRALSDMDSDGRLGCEEFVLAMHLCEQAALGHPIPTTLPPELIPPTFKRPARTASRTASISSQGSGQPDVDLTLISQSKLSLCKMQLLDLYLNFGFVARFVRRQA